MIRFILRFFLGLFIDRRGDSFAYFDGQRKRRADPFATYRRLKSHPSFDWSSDPATAQAEIANPDETSFESFDRTVAAVRDVFGVPAFEAGGLTDEGCVFLLAEFGDYVADEKKNGNRPPTLPPSTERESSGGSAAPSGSAST